ncbi:MAG: chromosome segregation protein SMC [Alphaproteobacteria bacterium]|nr:chromosome segregation protein SMC [Alphaproteobacteria bacterium]
MVQFTRLRLSGFKSFVDKTELEIAPGLNGIVGPNGCGKSNLVEALRWIMGESSAKKMRGGGMEDVIFSGTDKRSARNIAEVSVILDNSRRKAPPAYNGLEEIEIVRRIERDHGSSYKINSKNARARDVQMLFADTLTGANSPALVSQGHITRIINAKPADRRLVLEESAGVSGLYARRHEAELRLRAADANLLRLDDVLGGMETRLSALKRQSRQATKYKNLNAQIRQFEVMIAYLEWQILQNRRDELNNQFSAIENDVAQKLAAVAQLTKTQTTQSADLPDLRKKETEAAATLQTQKVILQRMEDDEKRQSAQIEETNAQLTQCAQDEKHESQTFEENSRTLEKIQKEQEDILSVRQNEDEILAKKETDKDQIFKRLKECEDQFTALKETLAENRANRSAIESRIQSGTDRLKLFQDRKAKLEQDISGLELGEENRTEIKRLEEKIEKLDQKLLTLNSQIEPKKEAIRLSAAETESSRSGLSQAEKAFSEFTSEIATLQKFFEADNGQDFKPVLEDITTEPGFEKALSRALGDALTASLDNKAPSYWQSAADFSSDPSLPAGAKALLPSVTAPKELRRALTQIGYVESEQQGNNLSKNLLPGQSLVSAQGHYWRWDGLRMRAAAADRHGQYIAQKNRLNELEKLKIERAQEVESVRKKLDERRSAETAARQDLDETQQKIRDLEKEINTARPALIRIKEKIAGIENEKTRLGDILKTLTGDLRITEDELQKDRNELESSADTLNMEKETELTQVQETLSKLRENYREAVRDFDIFQQQQNTRKARLQALADERISLQNRTIRGREQLKNLAERKKGLEEKLAELKTQPKALTADREELLEKISELESRRAVLAEKLIERETEVTETSKGLRAAELALGSAREERARIQATLTAVSEQFSEMEKSIEERFQMKPAELPEHAAEDLVNYQGSDIENLKKRKEKLTQERESIGPVNLQADKEADDLEKEVSALLRERNELMQAIEELRGAIIKINKEARTRLMQAFEHVNTHFQSLFTRLFEGGKAHLALIDSPDPLEAGLEIFAQPPGKTLQSLSLLSGGEQTLTSIALIFAMFLTNPSPICVLDEIDAPLDDANVDRVCSLLEEIAERGETRFLIITHHRLTMARMDRLYGVTMPEKGVSQLVSVDLQRSFEFTEQKVA